MKSSQSRSKGKIIGQARRKERLSRSKLKQVFVIDSDAELFLYLIWCIRLSSWIVRRLNWALAHLHVQLVWRLHSYWGVDPQEGHSS